MVLLRVAIGWHLLYEGIHKYESLETEKPWSAEMYLRNSTGPFRRYFRELTGDLSGLKALDADATGAQWDAMVDRLAKHYGFTSEQRQAANARLAEAKADLQKYLVGDEAAKKRREFQDQWEAWNEREKKPLPEFQRAEHTKEWRTMTGTRRELLAPVTALEVELRKDVEALATPEQLAKGKYSPSWMERTPVERINLQTMGMLLVFGTGMVLGLFSRLSAFGAAVLLAMFYFSMPPWPGLDPNPMAEGNYLIVNKNLIEMIACLMLATVPTGVWAGLDAIIRGLITRPLFKVGAHEVRDPD